MDKSTEQDRRDNDRREEERRKAANVYAGPERRKHVRRSIGDRRQD